jgi:hypothetical protein
MKLPNSSVPGPRWRHEYGGKKDDQGFGGGQPRQHERGHLLALCPHHPKGELLCHDQVCLGQKISDHLFFNMEQNFFSITDK